MLDSRKERLVMAKRVAEAGVGGVAEVPLGRLRCWPGNPRRISPGRLDDLQRALVADREMLWARPLVALLDGTVVCGNQRLRVAQAAGWETIPELFVDLSRERAAIGGRFAITTVGGSGTSRCWLICFQSWRRGALSWR